MCPRWAAIVPADKALIQHILSPRESSRNRRRRPSPPFPPLLSSSASVSLSLPLYLYLPSLWPVTWQRPCFKGNYRTMQGASQEFEELSLKKRNFIRHSSVIFWVNHLSSHCNQKPERKKQGHKPDKALFNCNSLSCLVKHHEGKENFSILSLSHLSLTVKLPIMWQHPPGEFTAPRLYLSNDFICEN